MEMGNSKVFWTNAETVKGAETADSTGGTGVLVRIMGALEGVERDIQA